MGYTWGIYRVFIGYTYVSGMCRVCVAYLSEKYREIGERGEGRGWLLAIGYGLLEIGYWR